MSGFRSPPSGPAGREAPAAHDRKHDEDENERYDPGRVRGISVERSIPVHLDLENGKAGDQVDGEASIGLRMLQTRTILVSGGIDDKVAARAIAQLLILDAENHDPIRVIISSQGGHVDSGFAIHDVLRFVESPVVTIGTGWVASIAVPILFGATKERRYSLPNTRFLLHQPSGGAGGQASDIRIEAEEILKVRARLNQLIANETGQPVARVEKDSDRNFWMDAEQAREYGLVGQIITSVTELA
jgi:ATP-dependent Clp protease protease subunit